MATILASKTADAARGVSRRLAHHARTLRFEDLPSEVVDLTARLLNRVSPGDDGVPVDPDAPDTRTDPTCPPLPPRSLRPAHAPQGLAGTWPVPFSSEPIPRLAPKRRRFAVTSDARGRASCRDASPS